MRGGRITFQLDHLATLQLGHADLIGYDLACLGRVLGPEVMKNTFSSEVTSSWN